MPPIIEDVKNYVEIKPVHAWGNERDVKLSARSLTHYTLAEPTRKEVFKSNYTRRLTQRNAQGYFSAPWRPYQEVGKPLHLDLKTIVKTGLCQESGVTEKLILQREESREDDNVNDYAGQRSGRRKSTISFLMQHRKHRDLQDISKYLTTVNDTKSTVKKGRSLFKVLKEVKSERERALQAEKDSNLQDIRKGSDTDGNTSSSSQDANTEAIMKAYQEKQASQQRKMSMKTLTRPMSSPAVFMKRAEDADGATLTIKKAKKTKPMGAQVPLYTPVHGPNIMSINKYKKFSEEDTECLRKELCVLHWLIEACNFEAMYKQGLVNFIPLMQCWESVTKPGGSILDPGSRNKKPELWNQLLRNSLNKSPRRFRRAMSRYNILKKSPSFADMPVTQTPTIPRNLSSPRLSSRSYQSVVPPSPMVPPNNSDADAGDNRPLSPTPSSNTTTVFGGGTAAGSEIEDDTFTVQSSHMEEDDISQYHINLQKLLSTVQESVDKEMKLREAAVDAKATLSGRQRPPVYIWAKQLYIEEMNRSKSNDKEPTITNKGNTRPTLKKQTSVKIRPHTAAPKKVAMHPSIDYSTSVRPKSSPAKLAHGFQRMSARREHMPEEMREKFREITDTKALQLHNQLGEMGRKQFERMETKFRSLHRPQSSMHRDFHNMRVIAMEESQNKKDKLTFEAAAEATEWYVILLQNLPSECEAIKIILQRIKLVAAKAAGWEDQQEAEYEHKNFLQSPSSQQDLQDRRRSSARSIGKKIKDVEITAEVFLGVLNTLRIWELCAPEVSAAVEFVRKYVVGMPPQQYEEWRSERIQREKSHPKSAPFSTS